MKKLKAEILELQNIILEFKTKFDWNQFKSLKTQDERFKYLKTNLPFLGQGTSRVTFLLPNTGYVLKLAKNKLGIEQNEAEVEVYTNPQIRDLVAKIRDTSPDYLWIVSQTVKPFKTEQEFASVTGIYPNILFAYFYNKKLSPEKKEEIGKNKFVKRIEKLIASTDLHVGDLIAFDHYGKTSDGRLALLDYGFTHKIDTSSSTGKYDKYFSDDNLD